MISAALFILGLKKLGSPATGRKGNTLAAGGMLIAIVATLLNQSVFNYEWILVGIIAGSLIGAIAAQKVAMTDMLQMVGGATRKSWFLTLGDRFDLTFRSPLYVVN